MNKKRVLILVIVFTIILICLIIALSSTHKYNSLSVIERKWDSIIDARTENNQLKIDSIDFNDYKLIIDEKNNTIYYSLENNSKNKFNPTVAFDSNDKDAKLVFLKDEITDEKVKSDYEFKLMVYNENEYHIYKLKCTDLPILSINYKTDNRNKPNNTPMEMYLFDNLSYSPNKIIKSDGRIRANENGFDFSLDMLTPGKNKRDNKISIFNMNPSSEYMLIKENREVDGENHKVELFINNEYKGVYSLNTIQ